VHGTRSVLSLLYHCWPLILDFRLLVGCIISACRWSLLLLRVYVPDCTVHGCYFGWYWVFSSWWIQLAKIVPMLAHPLNNRYFICSANPFQHCQIDCLQYYMADVVRWSFDAPHFDRCDAQLSKWVAQDYCEFSCNARVQFVWVLARSVHLWLRFNAWQKWNDG